MTILKRIKKHPVVTQCRRYLVYIVAIGFYRVVRYIPWKGIVFWGRWLGRFAFYWIRYGRKLTVDNLTRVFGEELTEREILRIAERVYENMGITALEFPKMATMSDQEFFRTIEYNEKDFKVVQGLLAGKKGAIFASAHMGNWEMLANLGRRVGFKMSILYKPSTNPYLNRIWYELRNGNRLININTSLPLVNKRLRANEVVCILFDENARSRGIKLQFLGRPASTYKGPAYFALRAGCPIVCAYLIRQPNGIHKCILERIIEPVRTGKLSDDIVRIMTEMNRSLENMVRRFPEQWNWVYKRWS